MTKRELLVSLLRAVYDAGESNGLADSHGQAGDSYNDFMAVLESYESEIDAISPNETGIRMTDPKAIQPALTKEQWAEGKIIRTSSPYSGNSEYLNPWSRALSADGIDGTNGCGDTERAPIVREDRHALIALCNHALPDDDRRKITRADVQEIRAYALRADDERRAEGWTSYLHTVAAKLAALLPPEER